MIDIYYDYSLRLFCVNYRRRRSAEVESLRLLLFQCYIDIIKQYCREIPSVRRINSIFYLSNLFQCIIDISGNHDIFHMSGYCPFFNIESRCNAY